MTPPLESIDPETGDNVKLEFTKIRLPSKVTFAGRIASSIDSFDFSNVKSIYLDQESMKDFIHFGN